MRNAGGTPALHNQNGNAGVSPAQKWHRRDDLRAGRPRSQQKGPDLDRYAMNPKRLTQSALATKVAALKRRGKTVVFTNGCFDLLPRAMSAILPPRARWATCSLSLSGSIPMRRCGESKAPPAPSCRFRSGWRCWPRSPNLASTTSVLNFVRTTLSSPFSPPL